MKSDFGWVVVIITDFIPAFTAHSAPLGESSKTMHSPGFKFNDSAHLKNVSGSGLLLFTSSALTIDWNLSLILHPSITKSILGRMAAEPVSYTHLKIPKRDLV